VSARRAEIFKEDLNGFDLLRSEPGEVYDSELVDLNSGYLLDGSTHDAARRRASAAPGDPAERKVTGQLRAARVVECDVRGAEVVS
jgi:hypothetical protein